jgi:hypothetical protein
VGQYKRLYHSFPIFQTSSSSLQTPIEGISILHTIHLHRLDIVSNFLGHSFPPKVPGCLH